MRMHVFKKSLKRFARLGARLFGIDDVPTTKRVVEFVKQKHEGMIYCADLLRVNAERGGERKPHCDAMVYEMVELIEKILRENGKIE